MLDDKQADELEAVVRRLMRKVNKYDQIGKQEFEEMLHQVVQEVSRNTGLSLEEVGEKTGKVIDDLPHEYGQLPESQRSWEAMIAYHYGKHLKELGKLR